MKGIEHCGVSWKRHLQCDVVLYARTLGWAGGMLMCDVVECFMHINICFLVLMLL